MHIKMRNQLLVLVCLLFMLPVAGTVGAKEVVGWVEHVKVYPGEVMVKAKVDTGAKTSSLDCECITPCVLKSR